MPDKMTVGIIFIQKWTSLLVVNVDKWMNSQMDKQSPVVQSIISFSSSLMTNSLTVVAKMYFRIH